MSTLPRVLLSLVVAAVVRAQAPTPTPTPTPPPGAGDRVTSRAQEMREQIGAGSAIRSHVRVAVKLKNGNRLRGVVKDGRLVERVDGLRFVEAQASDHGAGVRLWYTNGSQDYVFVPFADFGDYQVLERLSQRELEQIEREMQRREARQPPPDLPAEAPAAPGDESASAPAPAQEPAPAPVVGEAARRRKRAREEAAAAAAEAKPAEVGKEQVAAYLALLKEYPPSEGWNEARRNEIQNRKNVVGAVPSEAEQQFVAKFSTWQAACAYFAASKGKAGEATPATGTTTTEPAGNPGSTGSTGKSGRSGKSR